jgi:hypothetical protein
MNCHFDIGAGSVPFFRASYTINIREAHTGKVIAAVPVDPGAAGCPTSVKVAWGGAEVYSGLTDAQFRIALDPYLFWDGTGTPPAVAVPAQLSVGTGVVKGSVHMTTVSGVDPASPIVRDFLAFWAAYAGLQESSRPDPTAIRKLVDRDFLNAMMLLVDQRNRNPTKVTQGPVHLTITGVTDGGASASVDACVDDSERQELDRSAPDGTIGTQYRIRVSMKKSGASYLASDFADPAPGACPPAVARVG